MTTAYVVLSSAVYSGGDTILAIFADKGAAKQWAEQVRQAHPEVYGGRDPEWSVYAESVPVPFIMSGAPAPDPQAALTDAGDRAIEFAYDPEDG